MLQKCVILNLISYFFLQTSQEQAKSHLSSVAGTQESVDSLHLERIEQMKMLHSHEKRSPAVMDSGQANTKDINRQASHHLNLLLDCLRVQLSLDWHGKRLPLGHVHLSGRVGV